MPDGRYYKDGAADPWFAHAMATLADLLGVKLTEERIRLYAHLLGDVPQAEMAQAFRRAATERTSSFFPAPGELLRFVSPGEDDRALLAWAMLGQAVAAVGAYADLVCEDNAAAEALLTVFGSWPAFCAVDDGPALGARRQEFLAAYRQASRTAAQGRRRLPGLCAAASEGALPKGLAWVGVLPAGGPVEMVRDTPQLGAGNGHAEARPALAEGRDAKEGEGPAAPERAGGRQ